MISTMKRYAIIALLLLIFTGCANRNKTATKSNRPKSYNFVYVPMPTHLTSEEEQLLYMRSHYWDKFDFADSLFTTKADTVQMLRAYAAFLSNFVDPLDAAPIRALMQKASVSKPAFEYFVMLSEKLLHDPNSPLRSDELYIAVLEAQIASPHLDKYEKIAPEYDLRIASQNRIGHPANDFTYTLRSGLSRQMYRLDSDFVILYINNPGCPMCRDITAALKASPIINQLLGQGRLKILAIYPDEQLDEWHKHLGDFPKSWINGYDKGCHIDRAGLYDLRAIPALYLLDRNKKVLIKDSTSVADIEVVLQQML